MADEKDPPPQDPAAEAGGEPDVSLEQFLVACQKSLARSVYAAEQASRADIEFALGDRHFYSIDALEFDLTAAMTVPSGGDETVRLDFAADSSKRSRLTFRLETKPMESLDEARLQLADLDPLGRSRPDFHLRIWLVDDYAQPALDHPVDLDILRAGTRIPSTAQTLKLTTDSAGRISFSIRPKANEIDVLGDKVHQVDLSGDADFFISAGCDHPDKDGERLVTEMFRMPAPKGK